MTVVMQVPPEAPPEDATVNILLVDDEPKNLTALEAVLEGAGRRLVYAHSGPEALKHLLEEDFAVILLDVRMPGLDGLETAALIRGRERTRNTPLIFLTAALRDDAQMAKGYALGAVDYILKPFDPDILRSKVAAFVELNRKTEQVRRQAAELEETSALLNSVLEGTTEHAIVALDLSGVFCSWNEGARRIFGYEPVEVVGSGRLGLLVAPMEINEGRVDELLATARTHGRVEGTVECVRKDGTPFAASITFDQRRDARGETVGYVCIVQDITERLRAEEERHRLLAEQVARAEAEAAQRRLQFLAQASEAVSRTLDCEATLKDLAQLVVPTLGDVCLIDLSEEDGEIRRVAATHVDPGAKEVLDELMLHAPDPRSTVGIAQVIRSQQPTLVPSLAPDDVAALGLSRCARCATAAHPTSAIVVPFVSQERSLGALTILAVGFSRSFGASDLALAEALARRTALAIENSRLYEETRNALRIRDDFLTSATHDLKTPLTVIRASAQLLQRRASKAEEMDPRKIVSSAAQITAATGKMLALVDQLLDAAQVQMGKHLELKRQPTDLVKIVRAVVRDMSDPMGPHSVKLDCAVDALVGDWDTARIERVVGNLISNAIKYSPNGGEIGVSVSCEDSDAGTVAVLSVQDRGVGIPREDLARVFDRFFRARNVVGRIAGTGIGLAGVKQIVEEHGGEIYLDSSEGAGTTVVVQLPMSQPEEPERKDVTHLRAAGGTEAGPPSPNGRQGQRRRARSA